MLAHGVWLDDDELELVAERGATVVTNPAANMKLAVGGVFPYPAARAAGVAVGLGTDGAVSNNTLDLLEELKLLALPQKHAAADPSRAAGGRGLAIARGARSPLLGRHAARAGRPGRLPAPAPRRPELAPGDLDADLVYAASGAVVDTTVVAGRVLMRDREVEGAEETLAEVRRAGGSASPPASKRLGFPRAEDEAALSRGPEKAGHYESFYLKACRPGGGQGVWIRHTVHKRPGEPATCAIWFVLFDADAQGPRATKRQYGEDRLSAPDRRLHPGRRRRLATAAPPGTSRPTRSSASWDLRFTDEHEPFHHLPREFLYDAQLPKTKFLSPYPNARFRRRA